MPELLLASGCLLFLHWEPRARQEKGIRRAMLSRMISSGGSRAVWWWAMKSRAHLTTVAWGGEGRVIDLMTKKPLV
jgi:hypothetical protein